MPPNFTNSLAKRLNSLCEIEVKEGQKGETIKPGCAYIAPGDYHMLLYEQGDNYIIDQIQMNHTWTYSVDVLMNSISKLNIKNKIG